MKTISYKWVLIVLLSVFVLSCKKDSETPIASSNSANGSGSGGSISKTNAPEGLNVGNAAPEFTQNGSDGKPVTLASFRGKYVFIDFWASWCVPCKSAAPDLVTAYNTLKNKNFTILGVSIDTDMTAWKNAYTGSSSSGGWPAMPWTHVSDLKGWSNAVAVKYGVPSGPGIPVSFLIDPTGKIIGKNMNSSQIINAVK